MTTFHTRVTFDHVRNTEAGFAAANPVLGYGVIGLETDTGRAKVGDGVTAWNALGYFTGEIDWAGITSKPSTFPPSQHGHTIAEVVGLSASLDGKQAAGSYATLVGGKVPESQLPPIVTTWEGLTGKPSTFPPSAHSHAIGDVTGLQAALDGKQVAGSYAASVHTHGISDVTGLQTALDGKAALSHTHSTQEVIGLQASLDARYLLGNSANYGANPGPFAVGTTGRPSYYGTFDQNGNVEEWVGTFGGTNRDNPSLSMMRGGSYLSDGEGGQFPITYVWNFIPVALTSRFNNVGFRVASLSDANSYGGFVTVGDAGNANHASGHGGVAYEYRIGRYAVTNAEYVAFLNAVAATDANDLYDTRMGTDSVGGITRSGSSGSFTYSARANARNKPVNFVTWHSAARYCNWLHNGKPTGAQSSSTTEDGAYTITASNVIFAANAGAKYRLPTESEWLKSARYKGGGTNAGYWTFATQSDVYPDRAGTDLIGSGISTAGRTGVYSDLTGRPTLGTAAAAATTDFVAANDARLTDARTPLAHEHSASAITSGTLAIARIPTGQTSTTVPLGNDARFSDARTPTGAAGGDLTGTYPNPTIAPGAVVTADLADAAVTTAKLADAAVTDAKIAAVAASKLTGTVADARLSANARQAIDNLLHPFLLAGM